MGRILVTRHLPAGGLDPLRGHQLVQRQQDVPYNRQDLLAAVSDVDAIVCLLTDQIDAEVIAAAPRLRAIGNVAVGYDNVDVAAAARAGVAVCNTPGVLDETTADVAFGLIIAASRLFGEAERDLRAGRWRGWAITQYLGRDVHGASLGVVGYGRIGRAVARRAAGFGMRVTHHARRDTGEPGYLASLDELLAEADVVSLHVPLSQATRHLIGRRELALMKPTAVLVNTSRGPVVDEEALAEALGSGEIFAAGLDVFEEEPRVHPRLLAAPRAVLLPHVGSGSQQTRTRMARLAADGVRAVLAGERPLNLVSPSASRAAP
ncbi:MAG TPA: D-glycerate dehydrogenase [Actinomycetes bacterium]|jgi:glyoxylate reductase|nr:D-glycerate dehydrogenase [Actinomycetes bacterium]